MASELDNHMVRLLKSLSSGIGKQFRRARLRATPRKTISKDIEKKREEFVTHYYDHEYASVRSDSPFYTILLKKAAKGGKPGVLAYFRQKKIRIINLLPEEVRIAVPLPRKENKKWDAVQKKGKDVSDDELREMRKKSDQYRISIKWKDLGL